MGDGYANHWSGCIEIGKVGLQHKPRGPSDMISGANQIAADDKPSTGATRVRAHILSSTHAVRFSGRLTMIDRLERR
ncbi:hypothetical protein GCM10010985_32100 [Caballeronia grimmiae]|jgi:hypothetical protein|uniref:Uncharacterized protein n=1 Tax=Caballeronia grimmiae TaxID=1071679 RepID=A0ABQ1RQC1_9BURK|nr:hypothetical protein GCM10010985_32100 [Caballeronia grimmiae]